MKEDKKPLKRLLGYALLVVGSLLFMFWLAGLLEFGRIAPGRVAREAPEPLPPVFTVREVEIPQDLAVVAQVMSKTLTQVAAQVPGRVSKIWVEAGDRVRKDAPLVTIQAAEYQARERQALAGAAQAQAHLSQATADYERYGRLLKEGAVSPREFEAMETRFRAAQAQLGQAQAQVKESLVFKNYTVIQAPLTGVVAARLTAVGDLAQPGQPLLTLYDPREMQIEAEVNDEYRDSLRVGMPVGFEAPALDYQGQSRLAEIAPLSAPGSRTFRVRTEVVGRPDAAKALVPGLFARLYLNLGQTKRILIPQAAVREIGQLTTVEVLVEGRPSQRLVKLGRQWGDQMEVLAGLQAGEQVIMSREGERK